MKLTPFAGPKVCVSCGKTSPRGLTKERCATCYWRERQPRRACRVCGVVAAIASDDRCNTCAKREDLHCIVGAEKQMARGDVPCDICGATPARTVDHDHQSGLARGRLCKACNVGLGSFRDDPEILDKAAAYLRDNRPATAQGQTNG